MKALRYIATGEVALADVPRPVPGDGEVLMRVGAAGICHSDVHVAYGTSVTSFEHLAPFTLGHEIAGTVVEVGTNVPHWRVGMRAAVYAPTGCGQCLSCREGSWNYCDGRHDTSVAGLGLGQDGGLAEYIAVDALRLVGIGGLPFEVAAVMTDAALTSLHAISSMSPAPAPGSTIVVIGVGGLGHLAVQILAHRGYSVIGVDRRDRARHVAHESGAALFCRPEELVDVVVERTGDRGAASVLDFVGSTQTLEQAERVLGTRGSLVIVGSAGGRLAVDKARLGIRRGLSYHVPVWGTLPEMDAVMTLANQGVLRPILTRVSLSEAANALDSLNEGRVSGRLVVTKFDDGRSNN